MASIDRIITSMANRARKRSGRHYPRLDQRRILKEWRLLTHAHVAIHGGCSCGGGAGHIHIADFEQDILDYLQKKYASVRNDEAITLFRGTEGSLETLLEKIGERASSTIAQSLLADIAKLIESIARISPGH
jgi:hypothetical protein